MIYVFDKANGYIFWRITKEFCTSLWIWFVWKKEGEATRYGITAIRRLECFLATKDMCHQNACLSPSVLFVLKMDTCLKLVILLLILSVFLIMQVMSKNVKSDILNSNKLCRLICRCKMLQQMFTSAFPIDYTEVL